MIIIVIAISTMSKYEQVYFLVWLPLDDQGNTSGWFKSYSDFARPGK